MPKWFGVFNLLSPHSEYYVEIEAEDYTQAQMIMREKFGNDWSALTPEDRWMRGNHLGHTPAQRMNLKKLELPE